MGRLTRAEGLFSWTEPNGTLLRFETLEEIDFLLDARANGRLIFVRAHRAAVIVSSLALVTLPFVWHEAPIPIFAALCLVLWRWGNGPRQRYFDTFAEHVCFRVLAGGLAPRFSLWLRPFDSDAHYLPRKLRWFEKVAFANAHTVLTDLEPWLEQRFASAAWRSGWGPLIAVGQGLEPSGAGRVQCDDEYWKDPVEKLAECAFRIFLFAGTSPGLESELASILEAGHLDKTVFVMPPPRGPAGMQMRRSRFDAAVAWQMIASRLQQADVTGVPDYRPDGLLMTVRGGRVRTVALPRRYSQLASKLAELEARPATGQLSLPFAR